MQKYLRISLILVLVVVAGMMIPAGQPVIAQGDNLLENPGFEGEFIAVNGNSKLLVADGWLPWHLPPPVGAPEAVNIQPDYQSARADRIRNGTSAQQYDTFFATHVAGVYQQVVVPQSVNLNFSVFMYPYSSASFEDINDSIDPQGLRVSVGIDPTGGTDGSSNSIIWSQPQEYYDEYRQISVSTRSTGTTITVFVRSSVDNAPGLHQVFVDDAALVIQDDDFTPAPTTPVTPSNTPSSQLTPTATRTPASVSPTFTATSPNQTPVRTPYSDEFPNEIVHIVQFGDTIYDLAIRYDSSAAAIIQYNGLDANGLIFVNQTLLIPVRQGVGNPVLTPTPQVGTGGPVPPGGVYVVQAGDNLFRIALRYNLTTESLAQFNGIINPARIFVGQEIRIPTGPVSTTPSRVPTAAPIVGNPAIVSTPSGNYVIHIVQPGENVFRIGLIYNVTVDVIARANGLFNPNLIFVGQRLIIPR